MTPWNETTYGLLVRIRRSSSSHNQQCKVQLKHRPGARFQVAHHQQYKPSTADGDDIAQKNHVTQGDVTFVTSKNLEEVLLFILANQFWERFAQQLHSQKHSVHEQVSEELHGNVDEDVFVVVVLAAAADSVLQKNELLSHSDE